MSNTGHFRAPIGQTFGFWTVIASGKGAKGYGETSWLCRCRCGIERIVLARHVRAGKSTSCGHCFMWRGVYIDRQAIEAIAAVMGARALTIDRRLRVREAEQ